MKTATTLRRAARLLELQTSRVTNEQDASHEQALRNARGMIRRIVEHSDANANTTAK
jgi:hypothetical protein